jgi:putative FmdB family regulatory protein
MSLPIYEYQCRKCHHRFEQIRKFSDPPIRKCPVCGGGRVEKLLSQSAVHFKGSGWYITDYARKDSGKKGKGDKADGEGGEKESGGAGAAKVAPETRKKQKKT